MASNGTVAFAPVISALDTMQTNADRAQKGQAHEYLEKFQKSPEAWTTAFGIMQAQVSDYARMFAATTIKGKIVFDLHQIPRDSLPPLRDTLLNLLKTFRAGPKPIRTQLVVCLANLAIQMTEWKDVLPMILSTLGNDQTSLPCVLEFLKVLPEEVTEGRKINLSEDELSQRTVELLEENAPQVVSLLTQYAQSSPEAAKNPQLLDCITSWLREVPLNDVVNSPLLPVVIDALGSDQSFDSAVECMSALFRETRDVDECQQAIKTLYPRIITLRPRIAQAAQEEDADTLKGITRVFAEAGEAWVLMIARFPVEFRELTESILEAAARDTEREAIAFSFNFWYELKQYLTLEKYQDARLNYVDIYSKLVDIMIRHLEYPKPESGNEKDLFEGDREQEEKFREFRHQMGDVLKDCCEIIGVAQCLEKSYFLIEAWVKTYGSQATANHVPEWQKLEVPLFSMRAMGRMVPSDESVMLPRLMPLIVQIPDHEKVRFQAVMTLGRYTEWTAEHPDTLKPQLDFIMAAFQHPSKDVTRAAALSFKYFCSDCAELLKPYIAQLEPFYVQQLDKLPPSAQDEITEGVGAVIARLPPAEIYPTLKLFCNPVIKSIMTLAQNATDPKDQLAVADKLNLVTIFVDYVQPYIEPGQEHPAVKYCQEIFPVLGALADNFAQSVPILERVCRSWRYMILSYRTAMLPLLPQLADKLASGFTGSRQGCFLWTTDAIVREFAEGADSIDDQTSNAIFKFFEQQATTFLRILNDLPPEQLPDIIEDFFRLSTDVLLYHSYKAIPSPLMPSILSATSSALTLLKDEPLIATLHFLRDLLGYGGVDSPQSDFESNERRENPPAIRSAVQALVASHGEVLTQRILTGMMYSFPRDVFPDASGALLAMFHLAPQDVALWVQRTIQMLPQGSITPQESDRLMTNIKNAIEGRSIIKIRTLLQDFTNSYRRRNVAPREGLGRLEATKFKFEG